MAFPLLFLSPQVWWGCSHLRALSHPPTRARRDALLTSASIARIRMLKMAPRLGRRELGDRSIPLRYVAGRRATENNAGGHFQHPAYVPISQDAKYFFCSAVNVSIVTPMPASLSRAISLSMAGGTG